MNTNTELRPYRITDRPPHRHGNSLCEHGYYFTGDIDSPIVLHECPDNHLYENHQMYEGPTMTRTEEQTKALARLLADEPKPKPQRPRCDIKLCSRPAKWLLEFDVPERVYRRCCDQHRTAKRRCYVYELIGVETGENKE
jgi:hypothetical protein